MKRIATDWCQCVVNFIVCVIKYGTPKIVSSKYLSMFAITLEHRLTIVALLNQQNDIQTIL